MSQPATDKLPDALVRYSRMAIWAVIAVLTLSQFFYAMQLKNGLTEIIDPYSESNAVRAGECYVENGFLSNAGLPYSSYGDRFATEGHRAIESPTDPSFKFRHQAYTHYPQGAEWIVGVATLVFGKGRLSFYRLFPIVFSCLAMLFLAQALIRRLGAPCAAMVIAACAAAPMFSKMMHHLHFLGYTLALLLAQFAVLLHLNCSNGSERRRWLIWLGILAFVQGWFSFDYCFLVVFSPFVFALLDWPGREKANWKQGLLAVIVAGGAFSLAHTIHFAEVVAYYGSLQTALEDFGASASYRAAGTGHERNVLGSLVTLYGSALFSPGNVYFEISFGPMLGVALAAWLAVCVAGKGEPHTFLVRTGPAVVAAIIVSALWLVVMRGHALEHWHVLPRHWFLLYFSLILALAGEVKRLTASRA